MSYNSIVLVGGGTGISVLAPYLKEYWRTNTTGRAVLLWAARTAEEVCVFKDLLEFIEGCKGSSSLEVHIYLSRKSQEPVSPPSPALPIATSPLLAQGYKDLSVEIPKTVSSVFKTHSMKATLAALMVSFGIFGYIIGRLTQFSSDRTCLSADTFKLSGMEYFKCVYWFRWAPVLFSCVWASISGYLYIFFVGALSKQADFQDVVNIAATYPVTKFYTTFQWRIGRPDIDVLLKGEFGGDYQIAVLTAGPERLIRSVEAACASSKNAVFFRESWKP